jgi:multidrug resistance efflux pump
MRFLKRRALSQALPNEPRSRRLTVIRWVYIASVTTLGLWLINLFFGSHFFFRSEGLVIGKSAIVAAEFPVTLRDILVREGETVKAGQVVAMVSSQAVAENIARLSADVATRSLRQSELRIRSEVIDAMMPIAENREQFAISARKELETLSDRHYLGVLQHTTALENEFRGVQDLQSLKSEKRIIAEELTKLDSVLAEAQTAIDDLRRIYDDGRLRTPMAGVVIHLAANNGSVVRAGEPIIELNGNERYVLAYVPTGTLYDVREGDKVTVTTGLQTARGLIVGVEPFAAALPREFQRAFTPVERQQVIRIQFLPGEIVPPLFTKVQVTSGGGLTWIKQFAETSWTRLITGMAPNSLTSQIAGPLALRRGSA